MIKHHNALKSLRPFVARARKRLRVGSTLERRRLLRNLRAMDPLKMYVGNLPPNLPRLQLAEKLRPVSTNPIRPETYSSTLNSFFQHFPKPAKLSVV
jgi:hypothetical protein